MDLARAVDALGQEEDALGNGRLARIDVCHDADVAAQVATSLGAGTGWGFSLEDGGHGLSEWRAPP